MENSKLQKNTARRLSENTNWRIFQCENVWEPYFYLGKVLERKAEKTDVARNLLQKQMLLLQAAALYNFTKNCCMAAKIKEEVSVEWMRMISGKLASIQNNLVLSVGGDPDRCNFDLADKKEFGTYENGGDTAFTITEGYKSRFTRRKRGRSSKEND